MTIWISRAGAALLGGLSLLGCEDLPGAGQNDRPPLTQALMMDGAVTLVPPTGFCIDRDSLSPEFALLARCDRLGSATGSRGAPLGIMTVSFTPKGAGAALPGPAQITAARGLSAPERVRDRGDHAIFATFGTPPLAGLDLRHWRAVAKIGDFTMSAALFGPAGKRAVSIEGAGLLEELIDRTQAKATAG